MKMNRRWIVAAFALLIVGSWVVSFGAGRLQAQAQEPFPATRVAVVNISDVVAASTEWEALEQQMQEKQKKMMADNKKKQSEISVMQSDMEILPLGSPERLAMEERILELAAQYRAWQALQQELADRARRLNLISIYRKTYDTTSKIAQQRGIEIVMMDTPLPNLEQVQPNQLFNVLGSRSVLYKADRVDITRDVTTQMNADYANRG